jgi:DNA polymerase-3 subunit delta'
VLILTDFHLVGPAAPALLKSIEEPPETTIFVILAELVPTTLATIESRCVRIDFPPLGEDETVDALVAGGVDPATARLVAPAAGGRLDRARLLARDQGFAARHALWLAVPDRLDGTGAAVATTAAALLASTDDVVGVIKSAHAEELQALAEQAREAGERSGGAPAATLERHRREERRAKTDELRSGLATLAATYRDRAARGDLPPHRVAAVLAGAAAIDEAGTALTVNSGDRLVLEALLVHLSGGA